MRVATGLHLAGIGSWLPGETTTADAVAHGWYEDADRTASGMLAVRVAGDLPAPEMAVRAARTALRRAGRTGLAPDDYGALLHCATYHQGPDGWSAPHYVLHRTLDRPIGAAQVGPGCLAMLTALEMAAHRLTTDDGQDAVLLTAADNFSAPLVDRWNSSKLFLLADGGAAVVLSRRNGFARLLSVGSVSAPSMEELHRGGEELFPPGVTVGRSLDFEERSDHWRRQWAEGAAPPKVHLGDVVAEAVDRFGGLDVVVNNAGTIHSAPLDSLGEAEFDEAMRTMFWAPLWVFQEARPHLRGGVLVNITSVGGKISPPHLLPYACAKFAQVGLSEGLDAALTRDGTRVLTVVPGLMRTGSPRRAHYAGRPALEYAWFSLLAGAPLVSMNAARAARRIVDAVQDGRHHLTLTPMARAATAVHGVAPGLTQAVLRTMNRVLPGPGDEGPTTGLEAAPRADRWGMRLLTRLNDRAGRDLNQFPGQQHGGVPRPRGARRRTRR